MLEATLKLKMTNEQKLNLGDYYTNNHTGLNPVEIHSFVKQEKEQKPVKFTDKVPAPSAKTKHADHVHTVSGPQRLSH